MKKLYIEPTSMCNLKCKICFRNNWLKEEKQGIMQDDVLEKIYEFIYGSTTLETVMIAGMGEPLLHPRICPIVEKISKSGKKTELLTNATLLTADISHQLINSGLDILWCSIDKHHIDSIDTSFDNVLNNIKYFHKIRGDNCRLGLAFVVDKSSDLEKLHKFANAFLCDEINISCTIPTRPADEGCDINQILGLDLSAEKNYCPFVQEEKCFVKWNGDVCPCMQLLHSSYTYLFNEKRKVFGYSFGNVLQKSLDEIWHFPEYELFRMKVNNFDFPNCTLCDGCDDRKTNETDCLFNEMPTCGACLWAQNFARCP